eukprot:5185281-Alexandrium_andersonii.AAC.1
MDSAGAGPCSLGSGKFSRAAIDVLHMAGRRQRWKAASLLVHVNSRLRLGLERRAAQGTPERRERRPCSNSNM